jgi:hypothetical protein
MRGSPELQGSRRYLWTRYQPQRLRLSQQRLHVCLDLSHTFHIDLKVSILYRWANASLGTSCVVENTAYVAYEASGEFLDIVSRFVAAKYLCIFLTSATEVTADPDFIVIPNLLSANQKKLLGTLVQPIKSQSPPILIICI